MPRRERPLLAGNITENQKNYTELILKQKEKIINQVRS